MKCCSPRIGDLRIIRQNVVLSLGVKAVFVVADVRGSWDPVGRYRG